MAEGISEASDSSKIKDFKFCEICQKSFKRTKKLDLCWETVTTCSDKCLKKKLKKQNVSLSSKKSKEGPERLKKCSVCGDSVELAYRCKYQGILIK